MLTPEQQDEFRRFGILRVPGAVLSCDADAMCDSVWDVLRARYGIRRDDPETWKSQKIAGTKDRPKSLTFEQIANPTLRAIFDELLAPDAWERAEHWGSLLVSFPGAFPEARDGWDVPHQGWHLDAPVVRSLPNLYGVRLFTCLAKLSPGGGATLAVAGSPQLAQRMASARGVAKMRSADVRKALIQRYTWMKELCSFDPAIDRVHRFMKTAAEVEDVEVRVVEMTGEPGDVTLVHPLMMHAASPNCSAVPRIVLSTTVYQRGVDWSVLYGPEDQMADQVN
jgi:Phytanoyl-CoA dioxygenase (PhyH)